MVAVKPLTVHWHQDSAPIYSACFQPRETGSVNASSVAGAPLPSSPRPQRTQRLATAGGDNNVRLWRLRGGAGVDETPAVEYLATLSKHERAVNAVAFDASGRVLASAGDDGVVCLWAQTDAPAGAPAFGAEFEEVESWRMVRKCRSASFGEIYDLAWSPSGRFLAATSMDKIVSILDTTDGTCVAALRDHKHYVQGVAWDPQGQYLATQSSDQRVLVYAVKEEKNKLVIDTPVARLEKSELPGNRQSSFHPESFSSFFRRLSFSPDGMLLLAPAAQIDAKPAPSEHTLGGSTESTQNEPPTEQLQSESAPMEPNQSVPMQNTPVQTTSTQTTSTQTTSTQTQNASTQNCALIYTRGDLRRPAGILPLPRQSTVVRFCPTLFRRRAESGNGTTEYKMVYAIATLSGVFIYDTESAAPLGMASNLHYSSLTDLAWSPDGNTLLVTSIDGFCSIVRFEPGELGDVYTPSAGEQTEQTEAAKAAEAAAASAPALNGVSSAEPVVNMLSVRKKARPAGATVGTTVGATGSSSAAAAAASASAAPAPAFAGAPSESSAAAV